MSFPVSSHYQSKLDSTNPSSLILEFTFAGSVMSDKVFKYATISRDATDVVGKSYKVTMENASQTFNSIITDKTQFFKEGIFNYGFATESGTNDTLQMFGGVLTKTTFANNRVDFIFQDKLARLKDKTIGTKKNPVTFVNTDVYPSDLAWWVVTSFGGLDGVRSSSNVDIVFDQWEEFHAIFVDNSIFVNARFEGEDVIEAIQEIQRLTDSVIYTEGDNKVYFNRWTGAGSDSFTVTDSSIQASKKLKMTIEGTELTNVVKVLAGYNPTSETWATEVSLQNTDSVNSFGAHEVVYDETIVWYTNSFGANNLAERIAFRKSEPNIEIAPIIPFIAPNIQLGDEVIITTDAYSFDNRAFSLQSYKKDVEKKTITLNLTEGFNRGGSRLHGFILDDGHWGILDQSYNVLT